MVLSLPSILDVADDAVRAELIMAIGLVVDYVVHIVHFALHQVRTFGLGLCNTGALPRKGMGSPRKECTSVGLILSSLTFEPTPCCLDALP